MERSELESDIQYLPGVGPKRAALLRSELDVHRIGDLIRLYPFRYIDRSTVVPIADVVPDAAFVQIQATVASSEFQGKKLSVWVQDGTGTMELVFFKGIKYTADRLQPGKTFLFFGKPTAFNGRVNIVHPEIDQPGTVGGATVPGAAQPQGQCRRKRMVGLLRRRSPAREEVSGFAARTARSGRG